jgi:hypothetical protein
VIDSRRGEQLVEVLALDESAPYKALVGRVL